MGTPSCGHKLLHNLPFTSIIADFPAYPRKEESYVPLLPVWGFEKEIHLSGKRQGIIMIGPKEKMVLFQLYVQRTAMVVI